MAAPKIPTLEAGVSISDLLSNLATSLAAVNNAGNLAVLEDVQAAQTLLEAAKSSPQTGDAQYTTAASLDNALQLSREAAAQTNNFASAAGLVGIDSFMLEAGQQLQESLKRVVAASKKVDAVEQTGFMDSPVGWLLNKVGLGDDSAHREYEAAAAEFNTLSQGLTALNNAAQEYSTTVKSTIPATSIEADKTRVEALRAALAHRNAELTAGAYKYASDTVMKVATMSAAQWGMSREGFLSSLDWGRFQDAREARANADEVDDSMLTEAYKLGHAILRGSPAADIPPKELRMYLRTNPEVAVMVQKGLNAALLSPEDPAYLEYGGTPGDAWKTIRTAKARLSPAAQEAFDKTIGQAANKLLLSPELSQTYKTAEQQAQFITTETQAMVEGFASNMDSANRANPLLMPSIAELAKPHPGLPNGLQPVVDTQLFKKVLQPALAAGKLKTLDHQELFDVVMAGVTDKRISADRAAADLHSIVTYGYALNAVNRQFSRMGITVPQKYVVNLGTSRYAPPAAKAASGFYSGTAADAVKDTYAGGKPTEYHRVDLFSVPAIKQAMKLYLGNPLTNLFRDTPAEAAKKAKE